VLFYGRERASSLLREKENDTRAIQRGKREESKDRGVFAFFIAGKSTGNRGGADRFVPAQNAAIGGKGRISAEERRAEPCLANRLGSKKRKGIVR